jgi:hypothetical protein
MIRSANALIAIFEGVTLSIIFAKSSIHTLFRSLDIDGRWLSARFEVITTQFYEGSVLTILAEEI